MVERELPKMDEALRNGLLLKIGEAIATQVAVFAYLGGLRMVQTLLLGLEAGLVEGEKKIALRDAATSN